MIALHVSVIIITHFQEQKITATTASGNRYTVIDRVFTDKEYRWIRLTFKNHASHIEDGRTATLQMLHYIYNFSTNISTEYFKHAAHSPFFSTKCRLFHNATFFGYCIIHILHTGCAKI
jgi:hypothetical protein